MEPWLLYLNWIILKNVCDLSVLGLCCRRTTQSTPASSRFNGSEGQNKWGGLFTGLSEIRSLLVVMLWGLWARLHCTSWVAPQGLSSVPFCKVRRSGVGPPGAPVFQGPLDVFGSVLLCVCIECWVAYVWLLEPAIGHSYGEIVHMPECSFTHTQVFWFSCLEVYSWADVTTSISCNNR